MSASDLVTTHRLAGTIGARSCQLSSAAGRINCFHHACWRARRLGGFESNRYSAFSASSPVRSNLRSVLIARLKGSRSYLLLYMTRQTRPFMSSVM